MHLVLACADWKFFSKKKKSPKPFHPLIEEALSGIATSGLPGIMNSKEIFWACSNISFFLLCIRQNIRRIDSNYT